MNEVAQAGTCEGCPNERVHEIEFRVLTEKLNEVRRRVERVETTLGRGVLLLVANLAGMAMTLWRAYLGS